VPSGTTDIKVADIDMTKVETNTSRCLDKKWSVFPNDIIP